MKPSINQKFIHRFDARGRIVPGLIAVGSLALALQSHAAGVMPLNPVSAYRLDEATGTTTADSFGSNNGTLVGGAVTTSTQTPFSYTGNRSLDISSTSNNDYVTLGNPSSLFFPGSFSISVWVRPTVTVGDGWGQFIVSDYNGSGEYCSFTIQLAGANHAGGTTVTGDAMFYWDNKIAPPWADSTTDLDATLNQWYHIVSTWNSSNNTRSIYVNGALQGTKTISQDPRSDANNGIVTIGHPGSWDSKPNNFNGQIDEVAFFNYTLTTNEVTWLNTNSISTIPEPGPFGLIALGGCMLLVSKRRRNQL